MLQQIGPDPGEKKINQNLFLLTWSTKDKQFRIHKTALDNHKLMLKIQKSTYLIFFRINEGEDAITYYPPGGEEIPKVRKRKSFLLFLFSCGTNLEPQWNRSPIDCTTKIRTD